MEEVPHPHLHMVRKQIASCTTAACELASSTCTWCMDAVRRLQKATPSLRLAIIARHLVMASRWGWTLPGLPPADGHIVRSRWVMQC
jgi:hypothetical protein